MVGKKASDCEIINQVSPIDLKDFKITVGIKDNKCYIQSFEQNEDFTGWKTVDLKPKIIKQFFNCLKIYNRSRFESYKFLISYLSLNVKLLDEYLQHLEDNSKRVINDHSAIDPDSVYDV